MNCNFDNDAVLCSRCGKRGMSRRAKSNCLLTGTTSQSQRVGIHPQPPDPTRGPGAELKKLLARIGITATPNCKCNARVKHMDAMEAQEPGWCERNIDTVVGYLREAAADRGLPFLDVAGRVLVRRAVSNARKELARATQAANAEGSDEA